MTNLQRTLWIVQLMVSAGVAVLLPRRQWTWKVLAGISVVADLAEMMVPRGTFLYFKVYWGFHVAELLWLAFATSALFERIVPNQAGNWLPLLSSIGFAINAIPWQNNSEMNLMQTCILTTCAISAWLYAWVFYGVRVYIQAVAALITLELLCALAWRWQGYHAAGWFVAWTGAMALLWLANRRDQAIWQRVQHPE